MKKNLISVLILTLVLANLILTAILTFTIFLARIYVEESKIKFTDMIKALFLCFFEITILRQVMAFSRVMAMLGYKKQKKQWGKITRIKQHINN
mgnify:CR=1 FL=1